MTYSFKVWKLYFAYLFHILVKLEKGRHGAFFFFFFLLSVIPQSQRRLCILRNCVECTDFIYA